MDRTEAEKMLAEVGRTEGRLAEMARWPFHRHAMFGLSEGLLIAGLAQPASQTAAMVAVAMALLAFCVFDDKRRHGFFISGWHPGPTRPLTIVLTLFVITMAILSITVRDGATPEPLGYLIGAFTFTVCTAASLLWERIYRAGLARGAGR